MAEFQVVMKHTKRMCDSMESCDRCPMPRDDAEFTCPMCDCVGDAKEYERIVMDWAAKHPEPRYPSWNEAWKQLFPDAEEAFAPCLKRMLPSEQTHKYCAVYPSPLCAQCRAQPITPDVADKLGVKPIGGVDDENA